MLALEDLHYSYGAASVLKGVELKVDEGEIVALVGANGAGKTTTLRCISRLLSPQRGRVLFEGSDLLKRKPHAMAKLGIGHVLEGRHLFAHISVLDNLKLGAYVRADRDGIQGDLDEMLRLFPRLAERRGQDAGTLSGGEQQMLAIARALMCRPRLLLMDEPSVGLAPIIVRKIFAAIEEIKQRGCTILLVEQNAQMALAIADRGYVMELGEIVLSDTGPRLLNNSQVRKSYLGMA